MSTVTRLVGVYDADGTVRGELAYWFGARLGSRHCALCDITHGAFRERSDWKACRAELPVPFDTAHRNDMPEAFRALDVVLPIVVAETDAGAVVVLDNDDIAACAGEPRALIGAITARMAALGLRVH